MERECKHCETIKKGIEFKSEKGLECILCEKKRKKAWYENNKKRISEEYKKKYANNREYYLNKRKEYRINNPEKSKEMNKNYYENNKDKITERNNEWYLENRDKMLQYKKDWAKENNESVKIKQKEYRLKNKKKIAEHHRYRMKSDNLYAIKVKMRKSILKSFRERGFEKGSKTTEILGCSFEQFKAHIESKWEDWMDYTNRGLYNGTSAYGWDIDHIIPLSTAITIEDVIRLNHYTNLQPLCSYINRNIKRG